jgi:alpha-tubulin suppressor-like RCC1 family protein
VIKADKSAWCVGFNNNGQLTHDISTGDVITPAVQFDTENAHKIAVGYAFACFVSDTTGITWCAGDGSEGQLGDGLDTDSTSLVIAMGPVIK